MNNLQHTIVKCDHSRLLELGFIPGTNIEVVDLGKFGKVVKLRGAMIGLRNSDFEQLVLA